MNGITPGKTYSPKLTTAGRKDAFHVACVLCKKSESSKYNIDAGDRVRLVDDDSAEWDDEVWDGIADPFADIERGQLFWVFLRPERVKDLTHSFQVVERPEPEQVSEPGEDWDAWCRKCN